VEHNDVGIHEFLDLCREIETQPFITVNTGLGSVEMAAREVEYVNGAADTPMGKLRAKNGHPEPYGVVWWAVGNEMYGGWQLGHMPLEDYVKKHNRVAEAMRAVDPHVQLIAVGAVGKWSEGMLTHCADHMDFISEHFYCQEKKGLAAHVAQIPNSVKRIADAHRAYRKKISSIWKKDIRIALDEWNYWYGPHVYGELGTRYFLKDALGIAAGLHEYFRNSDIIFMANYAQTVNVIGCIKTTKTEAAFATTGQVLRLYRHKYGEIPVEVKGSPAPLDVAAAWTGDKKEFTVAVVNPMVSDMKLEFKLDKVNLEEEGRVWRITGPGPMAYNEPGKELQVKITEEEADGFESPLHVPALSIVLYRFPVAVD
jgi:alpha-N-arabinofuranosidase